MSMNIVIDAILVDEKNGLTHRRKFDAIQTPTDVTFDIIALPDTKAQIAAYKKFVTETTPVRRIENIDLTTFKPNGKFDVIDFATDHNEQLDSFIALVESKGFTVEVGMV